MWGVVRNKSRQGQVLRTGREYLVSLVKKQEARDCKLEKLRQKVALPHASSHLNLIRKRTITAPEALSV